MLLQQKLHKQFFSVFAGQTLSALATSVLRGVLTVYRLVVSPVLGPACRFYPSCSVYTLEAVDKYGVIHGLGLAFRRLAKCHPWHPGGMDLVP